MPLLSCCILHLLQVLAVLDWELATLGNPWVDVAYLCLPYHLPPVMAGYCLQQPLPGMDAAQNSKLPSDEREFKLHTMLQHAAGHNQVAGRTQNGTIHLDKGNICSR
eukprot:GHUV01035018.1.p2 GENE.GHUV01035018.1~~GHUV01035018.1.p2  ORF type:complete len:107 (+),score=35.03 GHUV01035018.1:405-725(+)